MTENVQEQEPRPLARTPTWSLAIVLAMFVAVSLLLERLIHHLSNSLRKTKKKPLLAALEKMKEEMMLLGFVSLLLTATSHMIANICIPSIFYGSVFDSCTKSSEIEEVIKKNGSKERKLSMASTYPQLIRRILNDINRNSCNEGYEPFVSYEGLEQLHRFIFVMAVTHITYSCLTLLLAKLKIHSWRVWEDEVHMDWEKYSYAEITRHLAMRRESSLVKMHRSNPLFRNTFLIWMICFLRQFGNSVIRTDYLALRKGFIMNHNLTLKYDFHSYLIQSVEEEFEKIVGVSVPLWGFVVGFMLCNIQGSNLYFWIAFIPISLLLSVGTKLQHVIATLVLENAEITGFFGGVKLKTRDELFWLNKPELLLSLIHFILFQNAFELASFIWFWWEFGFSCFVTNHHLMYIRLILGFAGQILCSYSTLPLYALVTQMGTNYKAALIPEDIRYTIDDWVKAARRKRRHGMLKDNSTMPMDSSTVLFIDDHNQLIDGPRSATDHATGYEVELQPVREVSSPDELSSRPVAPLIRSCTSFSSSAALSFRTQTIQRSSSLPRGNNEQRKKMMSMKKKQVK